MVAAIDLVGRKFGRLTVLKREPSLRGNSRFLTVCECGAERVVAGRSLTTGNTMSCGCLAKERISEARTKNLAGMVFGRLTAVSIDSASHRGNVWRCLCACGNESLVLAKSLVSGNSASCGCANTEHRQRLNSMEYIGAKFCKLTVIGLLGSDGKNVRWRCRCDCGVEKTMLASDVKNSRIVSCGCALKEREGLLPEQFRKASAASCALRRARKKNAGGSYTPAQIDDLYRKQRGLCAGPGCGVKLGEHFHRDHRTALSKGGSNDISNIELLCADCNAKKHVKDPIDWAQENGRLL